MPTIFLTIKSNKPDPLRKGWVDFPTTVHPKRSGFTGTQHEQCEALNSPNPSLQKFHLAQSRILWCCQGVYCFQNQPFWERPASQLTPIVFPGSGKESLWRGCGSCGSAETIQKVRACQGSSIWKCRCGDEKQVCMGKCPMSFAVSTTISLFLCCLS